MCSFDIDEPAFYVTGHRKARKQHRCCECDRPIWPGTAYHFASGKWDGLVKTFRTHSACREMWETIHSVMCDGKGYITHGGLDEEVSEYRHCTEFRKQREECGLSLADAWDIMCGRELETEEGAP